MPEVNTGSVRLDAGVRELLKSAISARGLRATARKLRVNPSTLSSAALEQPIRLGTAELIVNGLKEGA
ncbi:MAG: hypothetical protein RL385_4312 [Pseudomonadota bacterium]|jgi:hypothetical protein